MYTAKQFRSYFFRGIAALLPTILTIWLFVSCYNFVQNNISAHINRGLVYLLVLSSDNYPPVTDEEVRSYVITKDQSWLNRPDELNAEISKPAVRSEVQRLRLEKFWVHGVGSVAGFVIAIVGVFFMGVALASVVGKTLWLLIESVLIKTPVLKSVYPHIKQITDFLFSNQKMSFSRVVGVEYPRKGVWSLGMVTGCGIKRIGAAGVEMLTVFMPASPTPFTGYVIVVPRDEAIELDMTIEEAVRFLVSGGVLSPESSLSGFVPDKSSYKNS